MPTRIPELMAPAGTIEAGLAAFDAGADAVYVGLPRFNARERGKNCSIEGVGKLITFARRTGRRVYVTLNTLIKEGELDDVAVLISQLLPLRPHAVIVQDLGVLRLLRRYFPQLPIHASTQMGTHNSAGVMLLRDLGVERVILERQVTTRELERILEKTDVGIELFIHGALCCSRSGVCLFSSWLGGWSGNRGKCKQPCRRRYYAEDGNGFFFSARDLYSLDVLRRYIELGVTALKIEGRLRGPDYVRSVVSAYRMVLDAAPEERAGVLGEARAALTEAHGRKWSPGFREKKNFTDVIEHQHMGVAGLLCGSVVRTSQQGAVVLVTRPIAVGDRIRVQPLTGEEGPAATVHRIVLNGRSVRKVAPGCECTFPDIEKAPCPARIYRTGRATTDMDKRIAALPVCRRVLDIDVALEAGRITVQTSNIPIPTWSMEVQTQPAQRHAVTAEVLVDQFRRSASTDLMADRVSATAAHDLFFPAAELKRMRCAFWAWAHEQVRTEHFTTAADGAIEQFRAEFSRPMSGPLPALPVETTVLVGKDERTPVANGRVCRVLGEWGADADEALIPDFCSETDLPELRARVRSLLDNGVRRFRVASLFGVEVLRAESAQVPDVIVTASFPLPVCNTFALRCLLELGVRRAGMWVELDELAIAALIRKAPEFLELFAFGRIPILRTRAELPVTGLIRDDHGREFRVEKTENETLLFPEHPLKLPERLNFPCFFDLTHAELDEADTSQFNYDYDWV